MRDLYTRSTNAASKSLIWVLKWKEMLSRSASRNSYMVSEYLFSSMS